MAGFNREDYQKQVKELPREVRALLAYRNALRCLPLLAARSAFAYWQPEKRTHYLAAVLRALDIAAAAYAYAAAAADAAYAYAYAADAAADAAAADAAAAAAAADADAAANYTITAFQRVDQDLFNAVYAVIAADLVIACQKDALALWQTPLWPEQHQAKFMRHWQRFAEAAEHLHPASRYWLDWHAARLSGTAPSEQDKQCLRQRIEAPLERIKQGGLFDYWQERFGGAEVAALHMARIILIGNGGAGKTTLVKALNGLPVVEHREPATPRIEISRWQTHEQPWQADFWDFGGQVVMHATHQFFLRKRCVYLLVLQPRDDYAVQDQAEYWLEHVRVFGDSAPVLLVLNKYDQPEKLKLNEAKLQEKYPNIVGFYPLACTRWDDQHTDHGQYHHYFQVFRAAVLQQVEQIASDNVLFAKEQAVMEAMRALADERNYIDQQHFQQVCSNNGFDKDKAKRKRLLELLDLLGVVVHFDELGISDLILNPRWLTYGVYELLNAATVKAQQGKVTVQALCDLLQNVQVTDDDGHKLAYPEDKVKSVVVAAMHEFKICYRLPGDNKTLVIPEHLPNKTPTGLAFDKNAALGFQFKFELLLPRHLLYAVMTDRHLEIQQAWREGVLLHATEHGSTALIEVDHQKREIALWLSGGDTGRYLAVLRGNFLQYLKQLRELDYEERVVLREECRRSDGLRQLTSSDAPTAVYQDLLANERDGSPVYRCRHGIYDLACLLKLFPREYRRREPVQQGVPEIHLHNHVSISNNINIVNEVSNDLGSLLCELIRLQNPAAQELAKPLAAMHEQLEVLQQQPNDNSALATAKRYWDEFEKTLDAVGARLDKTDKVFGKISKIGKQLATLWGALHGLPF